MNFDELKALRESLIAAGRSLEYGTGEDAIKPHTHFYLLAFNGGGGAPRLTRSGTYLETTNPVAALGGQRGQRGVLTGMVRWDGDTEQSRHPLTAVGLLHTGVEKVLLAVESLEGIEPAPIDERPNKQRAAHPLSATD